MGNSFKAFIPYRLKPKKRNSVIGLIETFDSQEGVEDYIAGSQFASTDPTGAQWSARGLVTVTEDEYVHDLDGAGYLLGVRFNERMLPAKVRDEKVALVVAELTQQQGRKPGKKEYAEIRDQVEFEMLPTAFIRRTTVPVLITPENEALVFTGSAKRAGDCMSIIGTMLDHMGKGDGIVFWTINESTNSGLPGVLKVHATEDRGEYDQFEPTDSATLKGDGKRTVRVKDRDINSAEIQSLITAGDYEVSELGLAYYKEGTDIGIDDPTMTFALTDQMIFKRCALPDTVLSASTDKGTDGKIAFHSFAWIVARTYREMLHRLISEELGGEKPRTLDTENALHLSKATITTKPEPEDEEL